MKTKLLSALTFLLLALCTIPMRPAAAADNFDLFIVPTVDESLDSWFRIPSQLGPTIFSPAKIYPNQPFSLRILFRNYRLSEENRAHIRYDVQIINPDGNPTPDRAENLVAFNGPVKTKGAVIINQQHLSIFFDESYPIGEYEIKIIANDLIGRQTIARSAKIHLAQFKKVANFASNDFFNFWSSNYFQQVDVAKALFGILQYIETDSAWRQQNVRLRAFAGTLLQKNPWLWPYIEIILTERPELRPKIIELLALADNQPKFTEKLTDAEQQQLLQARQQSLPAAGQAPKTPEQVEFLWGLFCASGSLEPLEKVVRALKPFTLQEPPEPGGLMESVDQAAFWSLVKMGEQSPLAARYAAYLLEHRTLDAEQKIQLRLALELIAKAIEERGSTPSEADRLIN